MNIQYKKIAVKQAMQENEKLRKIAFQELNPTGTITLLCLHGIIKHSGDYYFLAKYFSEKYRIILPDFAGMGQSDRLRPENAQNYFKPEFYARDTLYLLKNLNIQKCYVIGSSWGGLVALSMNQLQPNLIQKLILNDIGPIVPKKELEFIVSKLMRIARYFPMTERKFKKFTHYVEKSIKDTRACAEHIKHLVGVYVFGEDVDRPMREKMFGFFSKSVNNRKLYYLSYDTGFLEGYTPHDIGNWHSWEIVKVPTLLIHAEKSFLLTDEIVQRMRLARYRGEKADFTILKVLNTDHAPSFSAHDFFMLIEEWFESGRINKTELNTEIIC